MTALTIRRSESTGARLERLARRRGEPVDAVVREALTLFVEDIEDADLVADFKARRAAGDVEVRDWDALEEELDRDGG